ncbi:MAG: LON peptidase substrate-binding domain-containing protein [Reyranellaceae bacterium]
MTAHLFSTSYESLPATLPIFPLSGVLLLPGGRLPLNIFEPRYLAMVSDALGRQRLIGMVQPTVPGGFAGDGLAGGEGPPPVQKIGCVGRIVSFGETGDGRVLLTLLGICRFAIAGEEPLAAGGYRLVRADYARFRADMARAPVELDRPRLLAALKRYFAAGNLSVDWQALDKLDDAALVGTISMVAPLEPLDKQALLEAADGTIRAKVLIGVLEAAPARRDDDAPAPRH